MRKWEMQSYINLAAKYHYVVVMAISLYRFDVTPEALLANNTDGLNIAYFRNRLRQWEDIPPVLTGWFLAPNDVTHLQTLAFTVVKELLDDGKFCRVFNIYDNNEITQYFQARKVQCCLAAHIADNYKMKKYYLSKMVQYLYGKCFTLTILGYHITLTAISVVVHADDVMQLLMPKESRKVGQSSDLSTLLGNLAVNDNMKEHNAMQSFKDHGTPPTSTITFEEWGEGESIEPSKCTLIHLAHQSGKLFNIAQIRDEFSKSLKEAADDDGQIGGFTELNNIEMLRLGEKEWLVKAPKKIQVKALFSGLYV